MRAAFELFGEGGEAAVTVRSVSRVAALNTRYFYESFTDTNELLGAAYDEVVAELGAALLGSMADLPDDPARVRAGIRAVLDFSSADPRRGRLLFTEARTNPVLAARRAASLEQLRESVLTGESAQPRQSPVADLVGAAMFAGAMAELAQQWLSGALGADLDAVVEAAAAALAAG